jgi:hypothetical protein
MNNVTHKSGFSPALMKRIDACAYIFIADKPEKIRKIVADREVSELEAGRIYTVGALKAAKRRGTAKTYLEALDALEAEQVNDRGCVLTRTVNADAMNKAIAGHRNKTNSIPTYTAHIDYVRMAWARMDNQPVADYVSRIPVSAWHAMPRYLRAPYYSHPVAIGKVLGSMYTRMEERQEQSNPEYAYINSVQSINMCMFFQDYESRLSSTVKARLVELKAYIAAQAGEGSDTDHVKEAVKSLLSAQGREAPETSKLANFAVNLWRQFEHKEALTATEFAELIARFG